jgi:hypothetical protein
MLVRHCRRIIKFTRITFPRASSIEKCVFCDRGILIQLQLWYTQSYLKRDQFTEFNDQKQRCDNGKKIVDIHMQLIGD